MRTAHTPAPATVALVDDHPVVVRGLRELLSGSRFRVVWQANDRQECMKLSATTEPDIILLDLRLGADLAPDVFRELRSRGSTARIVIVTAHEDIELLLACLEAGVAGILLKDSRELEIVPGLERVMQGDTVLDHRLQGLLRDASEPPPGRGDREDLTPREYEVLHLVARGMTSREISAELYLSVNTVRSYVQSVLMKLDAHTRIEAIATARRLRLL